MYRSYRFIPAAIAFIALAACQESSEIEAELGEQAAEPISEVVTEDLFPANLAAVLAAQPEDVQARYQYRHPQETLEFFGIEPGMTVLEALPGGGWYSKILLHYLGEEGALVGADYDQALFPLFGFFSEEELKEKETWVADWTAQAEAWYPGAQVAAISAMQFGSLPDSLAGSVDAVLLVRALHNLARFESEGGFLTAAMADITAALKPGGVVGIVQHMAPEELPDAWASGEAGYLKKSFVVETFEDAGLELVAETDINVNPADVPTTEDMVWRLPPSLFGSRDDEEAASAMKAIGESTRMTLLFRKPV
ncbi:MAG: methyltransferase [Pseudomonadota bacterium]